MGRGRAPCCDKTKVRTGPWSPAEDLRLMNFIQKHGHSNWRALPKEAGLLRCGKSCRLRWINYLRPDVKRGNFTPEEERTIIELHNSIGNKWSKIASYLPGRTDNEIKNVWNTNLKKRLMTNKTTVDCPKTEAKHAKIDCSASSSCTSSSITTSGDENMEKLVGDDQVEETRLEEKPEFMNEKAYSDSPSSSCLSDSSNSRQETRPKQALDDHEKIDTSWELDVDFWEMVESLDAPLQSNKTAEIVEEKTDDDGEVEFLTWLKVMENELGLTSDGDQQMTVTANPEYQDMTLEPEISTGFDSPIWPWSPPHYLGI